MQWKEIELASLAEIVSGATPKTSVNSFWGGEIEWATPKDLSNLTSKFIDSTPKKITKEGLKSCSARLLPAHSVLFSSRAPIGHVAINRVPMCTNQGFKSFVPDKNKIHADFLYWWLKSHTLFLQSLGNGATFKEVSKAIVSKIKIPLPFKNGKPDLDEQKRIAAILDKADAIRRKRRQALQLTDDFLRSLFLDMFGDPVTNPKGWKRRPLGEITSIEAPMVDPRLEDYASLLHYGPDRIEKHTGKLLPAKTALEDGLISGKFLCQPGEVLYSKIRPNLNKVALVKEKCLCSADVYPVKPIEGILTKEYLWVLLSSHAFLDYVGGFSRRANIPKLNRKQFAGYDAPIPSHELQLDFSKKLQRLDDLKSKLENEREEQLFASLQQRAFNGDL